MVIEEIAEFPDADVYRGFEGLAQWWNAFFEIYDDVRLEARDPVASEDKVVVQLHLRLRSHEGVELEEETTNVWTLKAGRAVHVKGFSDRDEALRAAGLPAD